MSFAVRILTAIADFPLGLATAWKNISGKEVSKPAAFDLNVLGFLVAGYVIELAALGFSGESIATVAPQHFLILAGFGVGSYLLGSWLSR